MKFYRDFKLGVLGGGQLGRMLIQAAIDFKLYISVLDPDSEAPCAQLANEFVTGSLSDFDTVYNFGRDKDLITIEIENVNIEALEKLELEGKKVYPQPAVIKVIQDKRKQKEFYKQKSIPTSEFILIDKPEDLHTNSSFLPAFQKLGKAGYDGKGVQKLSAVADFGKAFTEASLLEKLVDYEKELSVIVARNESGEIVTYPVVEMVFHPVHNLVEYLFSPADITATQEAEAKAIAIKVIDSLGMVGLLAVELFLCKDGTILVNEVAPRPHNSGHQTIKGNFTSQYEQHLRAILGLPLGSTEITSPSALVNLLGEPNCSGIAEYKGAEEALAIEGVYLHLYGKKYTKPFRKMGHVIILDRNMDNLKKKAELVKNTLKVIA